MFTPKAYSPVVSIFRSAYTVESLERINRVTGTEFPVSGTAYLRDQTKKLEALMDDVAAQHGVTRRQGAKLVLNSLYGKGVSGQC